jgi:hypothetical protein
MKHASIGALSLLLATLTARAAVPDVSRVEGIDRLKGEHDALRLIEKNGFVVLPTYYRRIFTPYIQGGLPRFVTADSVHRTFHVILEDELKNVERSFSSDVQELAKKVAAHFHGMLARGNLDEQWRDAAQLAEAFFVVGAQLAGTEVEPPFACGDEVKAEIRLVESARSVATSPLFGYLIDYGTFRVRSFYTQHAYLRRHFRAVSWFGEVAFRLSSRRETRAAILIVESFASDNDVRGLWEKIDRVYSFLLGAPDDLTPKEYAKLWSDVGAQGIASFRSAPCLDILVCGAARRNGAHRSRQARRARGWAHPMEGT